MLTKSDNKTLTKVGPGTPMGELMRRYWHPIAATAQLQENPVRKVRILCEDLTLYRDDSGELGLIGDKCAHRRVDLMFGIPTDNGLRCPYHGWAYDRTGQCIEMPYDEAEGNSAYKEKIKIKGYPVQECRGVIWAYLGPQPAPLLPMWDFLCWDDVFYDVGSTIIPCNYLQIMENSLDPVHVEWLHTHFSNYVLKRLGRNDMRRQGWTNSSGQVAKHEKIGFDVFEYGMVKRRITDTTDESHPYWTMGHPIVFPNTLKTTGFQVRVPVDDENTNHWWIFPYKIPAEAGMTLPQTDIPYYEVPQPGMDENGNPTWDLLDNNSGQDIMMWITQGSIADRTQERLSLSDRGIILYRKLLMENVLKVQRGEEPMNVFRDPAKNWELELPSEYWFLSMQNQGSSGLSRTGGSTKYSPVINEAVRRIQGEDALKQPVS